AERPVHQGGWPRGGSAERFEAPRVGGAARLWRRGGNLPAPAFPRRGKRERGRFKFLAAGQWPRRYARKSACSRLPLQVLTATQKPEFPKWIGRTYGAMAPVLDPTDHRHLHNRDAGGGWYHPMP